MTRTTRISVFSLLFMPQARLIPNLEQSSGQLNVMSPEDFIGLFSNMQVGGPNDQGFMEVGVKNIVERHGDIAHVFSTYE